VTLVLGHRGASKACPENTVEAFATAIRMGADGVELDVRRTADGVLVCAHDPSLRGVGVISAHTKSELPSAVATLTEALDACVGSTIVNVEIKNMPDEPGFDASLRLANEVVECVRAHTICDRVLISSFHRATVDRVRELDGAPSTGLLLFGVFSRVASVWKRNKVERIAVSAAASGHVALHPHHRWVGPAFVDAAHAHGLQVNAWTVDDPARIAHLTALGVDAIITNVPDIARPLVPRST
jgi:glycerophosphoryl diester phosphodiesterase